MGGEYNFLFYIFFSFLYLVYYFYRAEKKKELQKKGEKKSTTKKTIAEILEELNKTLAPPPPSKNNTETKPTIPIAEKTIDNKNLPKTPLKINKVATKKISEVQNIVEEEQNETHFNFDKEDLKKAVIYSEILNRPQF